VSVFRNLGIGLKQLVVTRVGFFRKAFSRDVVIFLCFVLVSLFFWTLQTMQEERTYVLTLPVTYDSVPKNTTITNALPTSLDVTVRDKGLVLLNYFLHRKEMAIHLNPMKWYKRDGIGIADIRFIDAQVKSGLRLTTEVLSLKPDTLAFYFVEKASKTLKVVLNNRIVPYTQHLLSAAPVVYPAYITAYAPQEVLNKLDSVETVPLHVKGIKQDKAYRLPLVAIQGVRFSTDKVVVTVKVEAFTEKTLLVPVEGLNFPDNKRLLAFPPTVRVSFLVGLSNYERINSGDFQVVVEHDAVMRSIDKQVKLRVNRHPDFVQRIRVQPEHVDCLIEQK